MFEKNFSDELTKIEVKKAVYEQMRSSYEAIYNYKFTRCQIVESNDETEYDYKSYKKDENGNKIVSGSHKYEYIEIEDTALTEEERQFKVYLMLLFEKISKTVETF